MEQKEDRDEAMSRTSELHRSNAKIDEFEAERSIDPNTARDFRLRYATRIDDREPGFFSVGTRTFTDTL